MSSAMQTRTSVSEEPVAVRNTSIHYLQVIMSLYFCKFSLPVMFLYTGDFVHVIRHNKAQLYYGSVWRTEGTHPRILNPGIKYTVRYWITQFWLLTFTYNNRFSQRVFSPPQFRTPSITPTTKPYFETFQFSYFTTQNFSPLPRNARDISVGWINPFELGLYSAWQER
jgi:hypothetical protein